MLKIIKGLLVLFVMVCLLLPLYGAKPEVKKEVVLKEKATPVPTETVPPPVIKEGTVPQQPQQAEISYSSPGMQSFAIKGEAFLIPAADIRVGKTIKYIVQLSWQGKLGEIEVDEPDSPLLNNLKLIKVVPSNKISPETNRAITEFTYHLKGMEKGKAYIGMIDARYRLKDGSGQGSFRLKEMRLEILQPKHNWGRILITGAIIVGGIAVAGFLGFAVYKLLQRRPAPVPEESEATNPYERIQGELASMRLFLVEGEIRDFYSKLTKLSKGFIAVTEGEEMTRLTTDELLHVLQEKNYNPEIRDKIFAILELCDRVKFAGYIPSQSENEQVLKEFDQLMRGSIRKKT